MDADFTQNNGARMCRKGCCRHNSKLHTYDWLSDIPEPEQAAGFVEVQFKNTRKGYYVNDSKIPLEKGDIVAVEASPGHDVGTVSLTGKLVCLQMCKNSVRRDSGDVKRIYRIARPPDMDKYAEAKAREHETMIRSRQIAADLGLAMKIGDVEYQGDGNKAIFYYIADERVDFRQLIRVLADTFRVRIEMKQIGSRQEAGRIGGIGPCGRELCCSSWMTNFVSVATDAARFQDISMNPQKLAGQCAKLKCCYNYEVDTYVEVQKQMPSPKIQLETEEHTYYHFKTDLLKKEITYSTDRIMAINSITLSPAQAFEVIALNRKGVKPKLPAAGVEPETGEQQQETPDILDESVSRFDAAGKKKRKRSGKSRAPHASADKNRPEKAPVETASVRRPHPDNPPSPKGNRATHAKRKD